MTKLILSLVLVFGVGLYAQERITLASPETVINTQYRVQHIDLDYDNGRIAILLKGDQSGEAVSCVYAATTNPTGAFLISGLNKANLASAYAGNATTGSLMQRIFHRLVVMNESSAVCSKALVGALAGSVP